MLDSRSFLVICFIYSIPVFIAALFTIARTWKHSPESPSTNEWIKKMWYV